MPDCYYCKHRNVTAWNEPCIKCRENHISTGKVSFYQFDEEIG